MKVWYHVIAALVGLSVAALIVYLVFGSASEQGAVQDGSAGSLAAGTSLCGTVGASAANSPATRAKAADNPPALFDANGPIAAISDKQPDQKAWVGRVHAASGMCLDELRIENSAPVGAPAINIVTGTMSTTDDVSAADASAFASGMLAQSFTTPLSPRKVILETTVGDSQRSIEISSRAWRAFQSRRKARKLPATIANLKLFQQATAFGPGDLRIVGW